MVEGLGVSQIFALLPTYLREMGVPDSQRLAFVGIFSALVFVVGMPLVPLWGAWADKYSRKVVIVRSALVEAVVFAAVALAREPWQVALAMLLIGFQLGNTGVMLGGIRDVTPRARMGTTIAIFGMSGAVGFAVGPALAGILIDGFGWALPPVFALSALFSIGTALLVTFGSKEVRPEVVPTGRIVDLAFANLRGVLTDRADAPDLHDLRDLVRGDPDEPAVHPGPGRADRRSRTRPRLGDRAGRRDRGARRRAGLAARWRDRRPDRLPARPRGGARRCRRGGHPDAARARRSGRWRCSPSFSAPRPPRSAR